jgi:hypothetical protein
MEPEYTKRELDFHFKEVKETLKEIKDQTTRTNGRVTALEKWMWMVIGGVSLLTVLQVASSVIGKLIK